MDAVPSLGQVEGVRPGIVGPRPGRTGPARPRVGKTRRLQGLGVAAREPGVVARPVLASRPRPSVANVVVWETVAARRPGPRAAGRVVGEAARPALRAAEQGPCPRTLVDTRGVPETPATALVRLGLAYIVAPEGEPCTSGPLLDTAVARPVDPAMADAVVVFRRPVVPFVGVFRPVARTGVVDIRLA